MYVEHATTVYLTEIPALFSDREQGRRRQGGLNHS